MAFGSFNTLERYALLDMGIRIDLPWQKIADESLATSEAIDDKGDAPKHKGPHCAIGEITYPRDKKGDRTGILIYIKASLTGDENDYIFDYKGTVTSRTRPRSINGSARSNSRRIARSVSMRRTVVSPGRNGMRFSIATKAVTACRTSAFSTRCLPAPLLAYPSRPARR